METRSLGRKTAVVSAAAGASRVLGFARDVLLAALLGSGAAADAFVVAFRIPSLVRRVLGEGALNAGVVPVLSRLGHEEGDAAQLRAAGEILTTAALALLILVAIGQVFAPWLVLALAGGFADDAERLTLASLYTRLMLPTIGAAVLAGLAGAILNAGGRVLAAALAPLVVNLVLVAVLAVLAFSDLAPQAMGTVLAAAVTIAGVAQLAILVPPLMRGPAAPRLSWPRLSPALRRVLALGLPGMAVAAAAQIGIVVATQVASHEPSAVARLYYADRLFSLPLGFVAAAAGTVFLPELARLLRSGDTAAAVEAQNRAMEWALLLAVPAALALAVLAEPIVSVLFERAAFSRQDTVVTASCLAALAFGLPAAAVARIQSQAFFAREDVRRPLAAALGGVLATLAVAILLEPRFGAVGVAWAVTAGSWVGAVLLGAVAARRGVHAGWARLGARVARIVAAALVMAAFVAALAALAAPVLDTSASTLLRAGVLAALCATGLAVFGLAALLAGAVDRGDLQRLR